MANAYKVLGQTGDASTAVDRPAGATEANEHYIAKGTTIAANDSITLTLGITLADTDVITVTASTADVSFSVFGTEIS